MRKWWEIVDFRVSEQQQQAKPCIGFAFYPMQIIFKTRFFEKNFFRKFPRARISRLFIGHIYLFGKKLTEISKMEKDKNFALGKRRFLWIRIFTAVGIFHWFSLLWICICFFRKWNSNEKFVELVEKYFKPERNSLFEVRFDISKNQVPTASHVLLFYKRGHYFTKKGTLFWFKWIIWHYVHYMYAYTYIEFLKHSGFLLLFFVWVFNFWILNNLNRIFKIKISKI